MRSWWAALDDWWCLRLKRPAAGTLQAQRSSRFHSAPRLQADINTQQDRNWMGGGGDKPSLVTTDTQETCTSLSKTLPVALPRLERVLDLSMMALLLGLFSTDLLANDMSAVTLVMDILKTNQRKTFNKYFRATWQRFTVRQMWPLTSRQTCASGSQTAPSASYLSPIKMSQWNCQENKSRNLRFLH